MRLMKLIGCSFASLYLVCVCFAVAAITETKPAVADNNPVVVEQVVKAKAEPVSEQSIVDEVADKIPGWLTLLTSLVTIASAIAAVTPTPKDNLVLGVLKKVLDVTALNVGKAKSVDPATASDVIHSRRY